MKHLTEKCFIYYPWGKNQGADVGKITEEWNANFNERHLNDMMADAGGTFKYEGPDEYNYTRYHLVTRDDPPLSDEACNERTNIFVWGHGAAGLTTITPYSLAAWGEIKAKDLPGILITKFSLKDTFAGRVKLYICESAVAPTGSLSFGEVFAKKFYKACPRATVFAYKSCVSMHPIHEKKDPVTGFNNAFRAGTNGNGLIYGRARALRFMIPRPSE